MMSWNLSNPQKEQFLDLLFKLGSHSVYPPKHIKEKLCECGVSVKFNEIDQELLIGSIKVKVTVPEWGEPGIYPMDILRAAISDHGLSDQISSNMTGRGFYYRDCLGKLASKWGFKKNYL